MGKRPDRLYWEYPVQREGCGTTLWRQNHDAAEILEELIPDYDPEQMVSDGEAVARDPDRYCLTAEGFGKVQMAAQKKKDFASVEFLKNWKKQVCLRPHKEWQEILSTGGGGKDTAR